MNTIKSIIFFVLLFSSAINLTAQEVYRTTDGHVLVSGEYNGNTFTAQSHKLSFFINYTTKQFTAKIDLKTLKTDMGFLDSLMANEDSLWLRFSGTIPDDDFITWEHPILKLNVPVTINTNNIQREFILAATIEHFKTSGTYTCSLSGFIELSISQFNFTKEGLKDTVNAQFVQVILKKQ